MLNILLRTKLTPREAEFVDEGVKAGEQTIGSEAAEWSELWEWAALEANGLARQHDWGGELEEDGEKKDTVREEKMEGVEEEQGEPLELAQWMKFVSRGEMPKR